MALGKNVAVFDWEWGQNSAPREGQKISWNMSFSVVGHVKCTDYMASMSSLIWVYTAFSGLSVSIFRVD